MNNPVESVHTLAGLWDRLLKQVNHEQPFLFSPPTHKNESGQYTYREVNAKAHCLAAFLLQKGLKMGDRVAVLGITSPLYVLFDLGLQLMGAVNVTVEEHWPEELTRELLNSLNIRALLIGDYVAYRSRKGLYDALCENKPLVCYSPQADVLQEDDQLILLDNALVQGNVYWREHYAEIKELKASIQPQAPATLALSLTSSGLQGEWLSQFNLVSATVNYGIQLKEAPQPLDWLLTGNPSWITLRTGLIYQTLSRPGHIHFQRAGLRDANDLAGLKATVWLAHPTELEYVFQLLVTEFQRKHWLRKRWLKEGLQTAKVYLTRKQESKKIAFGLRLRYLLYRNQVLQPLKRKYLPHLQRIVTPAQQLKPEVHTFFNAVETPLLTGLELASTSGFFSLQRWTEPRLKEAGIALNDMRVNANNARITLSGAQVRLESWPQPDRHPILDTQISAHLLGNEAFALYFT